MLIKIVFNSQIRLFDSKDNTLNIEDIYQFIKRTFPTLTQHYTLYYIDEDQDHIILMTNDDLINFTEVFGKKLKIYIKLEDSESTILDQRKYSVDEDVVKRQEYTQPQEVKQNNQQIVVPKHQNIEKVQQKTEQKMIELEQQLQEKQQQIEHKEIKQIDLQEIPDQVKQVNQDQKKEQTQNDQPPYKLQEIQSHEERIEKELHEQVKNKIEKEVHEVRCDSCGMMPIVGIRYKCGVCQNFDLCETCEQQKGHYEHPLIKIRFAFQTPIKVKLVFPKNIVKPIQKPKGQRIRYQTFIQRQKLIISYLQNLLGPQNSQFFGKFAIDAKSVNYEQLFDEYLQWVQNQEGKIPKLLKWIQSYLPSFSEPTQVLRKD